jgi:TPR repeat protein
MAGLNFGNLLVKGEGVEADPARARDIFDTWCIRNHARSCVRGGHLLREGKGGPKDPAKAAQVYVQACEVDDYEGCYWAGFMAATGQSGALNYTGALQWLGKACTDGHLGYACYFAGLLNEMGKGPGTSRRRGMALFQKGCAYKDAKSCKKLNP